MIDDDDIWTTSDTDLTATADNYPTADVDSGGRGFWSIGRVVVVVAVAVVVGALAYLVASRVGEDEQVSTPGDMTPDSEVPATDLWGREWEVDRLEMGADVAVQWSKGDTATALFLDLTVQGEVRYTGCNGGFGTATYADGILKADDLVGTEMGCEGDEGAQLMAYDKWMAAFLVEGVAVTFDDDGSLILSGADGTARLSGPGEVTGPDDSATTDPIEPGNPDESVSNDALAANLWGHQWELRSIIPSDSFEGRELAMLPDDTTPVLDTTTTDVLTISGCNGTGGAVHLDGAVLVADGPWAQTKMACEPKLMDQEQFLTTFLDAGPKVSIKDDLLTLTGEDWLVLAVRP